MIEEKSLKQVPVHPFPEYINIALGRLMDPDNVSQWFIDDINRLLLSVTQSIAPCQGYPIVSTIKFHKTEKGLVVSARVHKVFVRLECFNEETRI